MASRASSRTLGMSPKQQKSNDTQNVSQQDSSSSEDTSCSTHEEPIKKISTMAFEVNKAPKLEGADRKDLMKFLEDYKTYLEVFDEAGADGMEPRPLKTMIKSYLLKAICRYELKVEEAEVRAS